MESLLAAISTQQALADASPHAARAAHLRRVQSLPRPRLYGGLSLAVIGSLLEHRWLVIPATLVIAFAFRIVERIGSVVEAPFGNTTQDAPLTATGTWLERDLLELVGEPLRPAAPAVIDGYLW